MRKGDILSSGFSYLSECGVLDVICLLPGSTTTFYKADEIGSTLSFYNHARGQELGWGKHFIMPNLIYKNGTFSFDENTPELLNADIVDMSLIIYDDVPSTQQNALMNMACDYVNQRFGTNYQAFPGDKRRTEIRDISCICEFNFRMKK